MKSISVSVLKARLSEELEHVQAGEVLTVTDRGRPVARIVPVSAAEDGDAHLERLRRSGLIRLGAPVSMVELDALALPSDPESRLAAALAAEREGGW